MANWTRSTSCSDTCQSKRQSGIAGCKQKLRIAVNDRLESNQILLDRHRRQGGCFNPPWATDR